MDSRQQTPATPRCGIIEGAGVASSGAVIGALESVWHQVRHDGIEDVNAPGLRGQLHRVATEARAANMPPEQLLGLLKASWRNLPEVRRVDRPEVASDLLGRIVTMCIEEYFA